MMTDRTGAQSGRRPAVSVVVPFLGDAGQAVELLAALQALRLRPGDELIVADNTPDGVLEGVAPDAVQVVLATAERSSYHPRNVGADRAGNEWLLFTDADCRPTETLLDDYFGVPVDDSVGALAGDIVPADQGGLMTRWARSRRILDQRASLGGRAPAGATANLLVRKTAWDSVGGFLEGVRSGADFEFCWRLRDAGWKIGPRPGAVVEHLHRETLRAMVRQMARYAAGNAWQERRRPGSSPRPPAARALARSAAGVAGFALTGRFRRAALKAVDGVAVVSQAVGRLLGNAAPRDAPKPANHTSTPRLLIATDRFPVPSEAIVVDEAEALARLGWRVRVEAVARPAVPLRGAGRDLDVSFLEDDGKLERATATVWVAARHPIRCLVDLASRHRGAPGERLPLSSLAPMIRRIDRSGERRIHVHFARVAAVNAQRAGRILGVSVSIAPSIRN